MLTHAPQHLNTCIYTHAWTHGHDDTHTAHAGCLERISHKQQNHSRAPRIYFYSTSVPYVPESVWTMHQSHASTAPSMLLPGHMATGEAAGSICRDETEKWPSTSRKASFLSFSPSSSASFDLVLQAQMVTNKRPCCRRILMLHVKECVGVWSIWVFVCLKCVCVCVPSGRSTTSLFESGCFVRDWFCYMCRIKVLFWD